MHAGNRSVCSVYLYLHLPHVPIFPFEGLREDLLKFSTLPCQPCLASPQNALNSTYLHYLLPRPVRPHPSHNSSTFPLSVGVPCRSCTYLRYLDTYCSSFLSLHLFSRIATRDVRVRGQFNSNGRFESTTVVIVWKRQDARATTTIQVEYPTHVDL